MIKKFALMPPFICVSIWAMEKIYQPGDAWLGTHGCHPNLETMGIEANSGSPGMAFKEKGWPMPRTNS